MSELRTRSDNLKKLNNYRIFVGVPADDAHLNMVAIVQEKGAFIVPKNSKYLCIPTKDAKGRKPQQIPKLYKRGMTLGVNDKSQSNGYTVMFILRNSVRIPPRPFLRTTYDNNKSKWDDKLGDLCFNYLLGKFNDVDDIYNQLGKQMVNDMKDVIKDYKFKENAPLTEYNKGFNDPLIDKKTLLNSITWFIEKKI